MQPEAVYDWLFSIQSSPKPCKRKFCQGADDECFSMSSPSKRARPATPESLTTRGYAQAQYIDVTPTQSSYKSVAVSLAQREILAPRSPAIRSSSRSRSPDKFKIRTIPDLSRLAVPVEFTFPFKFTEFIPSASARKLYRQLVLIEHSHGILPTALKVQIESLVSEHSLVPCMWEIAGGLQAQQESSTNDGEPSIRPCQGGCETEAQGLIELETIKDIIRETRKCYRKRATEAHWNSSVHQKVLELALKRHPSVGVTNITRAQTADTFRPRLSDSDGDAVSLASTSSATTENSDIIESGGLTRSFHKMVDFGLYLDVEDAEEPEVRELAGLVKRFLAFQPSAERWINAMSYEYIRNFPTPVYIETKSGSGKPEDASVQLAMCLAGWHNRMRCMMDQTGRHGETAHIITVPAIIVFEAEWEVVFVVDGRSRPSSQDEIYIVGPSLKLGNTSSIVGMYRLLAGLRAIAEWMHTDFRSWIKDVLQDVTSRQP